jgi:hypothetical protein
MKKLTICTLVIFGLIFLGCDNSTEDESDTYTVTFATYASSTIPSQSVTNGGKVSTVGNPSGGPANGTFTGWYKNGGIDAWDFAADVVTDNMTLCAGWKFPTIDNLTTFLNTATATAVPAARHTIQGVDPNAGKLSIPVAVQIQLTRDNWAKLVKGIESKNKKVSLDLTACTVGTGVVGGGNAASQEGGLWANGTFNPLDAAADYLPNPGGSRVNNTIAGLILPNAATTLYQAPTNLNLLKDIRGNEVTTISTNGSFHGGLMAKVYFPKLTDIADHLQEAMNLEVAYLPAVTAIEDEAFKWTWIASAPGVYDVQIPKAASIGNNAFALSGPGNLTITLGTTPPSLGTQIFDGVTQTKRVTVRVPAASKAAYTTAWEEGLKGKGWSNAGVGTGTLMRNINVTIEGY